MNFIDLVNGFGKTMVKDEPPIPVSHPSYGLLGACSHKGFVPDKRRWASANAILRDSSRNSIRLLRFMEDNAPHAVVLAVSAMLRNHPLMAPVIIGAISTYDGILAARGSGASQDIWLTLTGTAFTPVTLNWYDLMKVGFTPGSVPSISEFVHNGTAGAILNSASNGNWLTDPGGTNKKYLTECTMTTTNLTGYSMALLMDNLWAGWYLITGNTTITPTSPVALVRYSGTASAGNRITTVLETTLTHTVPGTATFTYTDQSGTGGKTLISVPPATGALLHRVIFNTLHNSSTVIQSSPFMPMTNAGSTGVRSIESITIAGGTISAGTVETKIVRPLMMIPFIAANSPVKEDSTGNPGNIIELVNASQVCGCLSWSVFTGGTTAATIAAMLRTVEG
jgi:hypothetical protein